MDSHPQNKKTLAQIADEAMVANGLEPNFPPEVLKQLEGIQPLARKELDQLKDLTGLLWCSIDNDDSRDLDQISASERLDGGKTRLYVGVADVDALVKNRTAIDTHAQKNTTSVYTGVKTFPMLPERLSTDLTSLSENEERAAMIIEMVVDQDGKVGDTSVYRARVKNKAKLTYNGVAAWLDNKGPLPAAAARVKGMDEQLKTQDEAAQRMRKRRYDHGALDFQSLQTRAVTQDGVVVDLKPEIQNRAGELIEDLMVAANGVTARFLTGKGCPTLRRVVKTPERWPRIVEVAKSLGTKLPEEPDSKALGVFLTGQKAKDPVHFPDLSLTIVKLMGRGEYVLDVPGQEPTGHFGLAVKDYNHSTAPNRRYPDLITMRLLKTALENQAPAYSLDELSMLAKHCTGQENASEKVERQMRKSASAAFLSPRIGQFFDAIITGASEKGTWVRVLQPPVEGYLAQGGHGLDVGDRVRVKLITVNVEKGFIDFARVTK
jgi:exoribonuclease-2